jgi:hypothetical protein
LKKLYVPKAADDPYCLFRAVCLSLHSERLRLNVDLTPRQRKKTMNKLLDNEDGVMDKYMQGLLELSTLPQNQRSYDLRDVQVLANFLRRRIACYKFSSKCKLVKKLAIQVPSLQGATAEQRLEMECARPIYLLLDGEHWSCITSIESLWSCSLTNQWCHLCCSFTADLEKHLRVCEKTCHRCFSHRCRVGRMQNSSRDYRDQEGAIDSVQCPRCKVTFWNEECKNLFHDEASKRAANKETASVYLCIFRAECKKCGDRWTEDEEKKSGAHQCGTQWCYQCAERADFSPAGNHQDRCIMTAPKWKNDPSHLAMFDTEAHPLPLFPCNDAESYGLCPFEGLWTDEIDACDWEGAPMAYDRSIKWLCEHHRDPFTHLYQRVVHRCIIDQCVGRAVYNQVQVTILREEDGSLQEEKWDEAGNITRVMASEPTLCYEHYLETWRPVAFRLTSLIHEYLQESVAAASRSVYYLLSETWNTEEINQEDPEWRSFDYYIENIHRPWIVDIVSVSIVQNKEWIARQELRITREALKLERKSKLKRDRSDFKHRDDDSHLKESYTHRKVRLRVEGREDSRDAPTYLELESLDDAPVARRFATYASQRISKRARVTEERKVYREEYTTPDPVCEACGSRCGSIFLLPAEHCVCDCHDPTSEYRQELIDSANDGDDFDIANMKDDIQRLKQKIKTLRAPDNYTIEWEPFSGFGLEEFAQFNHGRDGKFVFDRGIGDFIKLVMNFNKYYKNERGDKWTSLWGSHNGGNFDLVFVEQALDRMADREFCGQLKKIYRSSRLMRLGTQSQVFIDTYNHMSFPLKMFGKAFGLEHKKGETDFDWPRWVARHLHDSMRYPPKIFRARIQQMIEYCQLDTDVLLEGAMKMSRCYEEIFQGRLPLEPVNAKEEVLENDQTEAARLRLVRPSVHLFANTTIAGFSHYINRIFTESLTHRQVVIPVKNWLSLSHMSFNWNKMLYSAFLGGICQIYRPYYKCEPGEFIDHYDVVSMYAAVMKQGRYPVGSVFEILERDQREVDVQKYGSVRKYWFEKYIWDDKYCYECNRPACYRDILAYADHNLWYCWKCARLEVSGPRMQDDIVPCAVMCIDFDCPNPSPYMTQPIIGVRVEGKLEYTLEPRKRHIITSLEWREAAAMGYRLLRVHYMLLWPNSVRGLFRDFVDLFYKKKCMSSYSAAGSVNDTHERREEMSRVIFEQEGIRINPLEWCDNPAMKNAAKQVLNSAFGKTGQNIYNKLVCDVISPNDTASMQKFEELLEQEAFGDLDHFIVEPHEMYAQIFSQAKSHHQEHNGDICVIVAVWTTALARSKLRRFIHSLDGDCPMYCDTDSLFFISRSRDERKDNIERLWCDDRLGYMKNELPNGVHIVEAAFAARKNYSYLRSDGLTNRKSKGLSGRHLDEAGITHDRIVDVVLNNTCLQIPFDSVRRDRTQFTLYWDHLRTKILRSVYTSRFYPSPFERSIIWGHPDLNDYTSAEFEPVARFREKSELKLIESVNRPWKAEMLTTDFGLKLGHLRTFLPYPKENSFDHYQRLRKITEWIEEDEFPIDGFIPFSKQLITRSGALWARPSGRPEWGPIGSAWPFTDDRAP